MAKTEEIKKEENKTKAATKKKEAKAKSTDKKKYLVIVESPAKSKTIKKILGDEYEIKASMGHIRDLPKKGIGVSARKKFEPEYEIIDAKKKVVDELKAAAKGVDIVYLAPDPDREGEAIAWHVSEVIGVPKKKQCRIVFNEITKNAIIDAVNNPTKIDIDKVNAQKARQILDRIVGYKISPVLWQKLRNYKLSAGRVQSVAVRVLCDREAEIDAFEPQEYWTIDLELGKARSTLTFLANLTKKDEEKIEINNEKEAQEIVDDLKKKGVEFSVSKITNRESKRNPQAPFITSTLQREASTRLGYGVGKTMQVAQKLYEGITLGSEGPVGLITYMRTDSTRISDEARDNAKDYITSHYGKNYYPEKARSYAKKGKNAQDAHEAIRPSYVEKSPEMIKQYLTSEQYKLYKLIWNRFVASQMESAKVKNTTVEISAENYTFRAGSSKVTFDGFLIVYDDKNADADDKKVLPELKKGDVLKLKNVDPKQHFTQPPPRYSEASLVKTLEELGIGRPSTYASIITKIQQRNYVVKEEKALVPTQLGKVVNEQLIKHFTDIVDFNFTAGMETHLDEIAEHNVEWKQYIEDFYKPFNQTVKDAKENMEQVEILSDEKCPNCGKPLALRSSRWGTQFYGCTGYPECKTSVPMTKDNKPAPDDKPSDEICDKCNSPMVIRYGPYGEYLACSNDDCKNKKKFEKKTGLKCPKEGCEGDIVQKKSRYGKFFYGCNQYPNCDVAYWHEPTGDKCPECGSMLVFKRLKRGDKIACSVKECKYEKLATEE